MRESPAERILVIKLSALGDFIQALGPMAAIRKHHKNAHITLMTTKGFQSFAQKSGYFDDIIIDERPKTFNIGSWIRLRSTLINGNYNRVYDLQNNDRTALYFKLFPKAKRPEWVGTAKGASHENNAPERIAGHAFDGHAMTLKLAGIDNVHVDSMKWINDDIGMFNLKTPYILFVPGSAPQHPQKRWPKEKYGAIANLLSAENYQIVLLGTDAERDVTGEIKELCPAALDLTGQTSLFQIISLAHGASGALGNDTGPMHMIGPTGCPSLVLFSGHSTPERHAPKGDNVKTMQADNISELETDAVYNDLLPMLRNQAAPYIPYKQ